MPNNNTIPDLKNGQNKLGLWTGLGCLSVFILSFGLLIWWAQMYGVRFLAESKTPLRSAGAQLMAYKVLLVAQEHCNHGKVSGNAAQWFDSKATEQTLHMACTIDITSLRKVDEPEAASEKLLSETNQAAMAHKLGLDPTMCYRYATDAWNLIGCYDLNTKGPMPYKIIDIRPSVPTNTKPKKSKSD